MRAEVQLTFRSTTLFIMPVIKVPTFPCRIGWEMYPHALRADSRREWTYCWLIARRENIGSMAPPGSPDSPSKERPSLLELSSGPATSALEELMRWCDCVPQHARSRNGWCESCCGCYWPQQRLLLLLLCDRGNAIEYPIQYPGELAVADVDKSERSVKKMWTIDRKEIISEMRH